MTHAQAIAPDSRLASRYFTSFEDSLLEFTTALTEFSKQVRCWKEEGASSKLPRSYQPFQRLIDAGMIVSRKVLDDKGPPRGQADNMVAATDLFPTFQGEPEDIFEWMETNQPHFDLLVEAMLNWPAKEDAPDEIELVLEVGAFTLHNTIESEGDQLDQIKQLLVKVERHLGQLASVVVGLTEVVTGDVMLVSTLSCSDTAAWHNAGEDKLYIRPVRSTGLDHIQALIHELGHRYWQNQMSDAHKRAWNDYHATLVYGEVPEYEVPIPEVGQEVVITVPIEGGGEDAQFPTVERIVGDRIYIEGGRYLTRRQFDDYYQEAAALSMFPSSLAGSSRSQPDGPEVHFCEALAFKAIGQLAPTAMAQFDEVFRS